MRSVSEIVSRLTDLLLVLAICSIAIAAAVAALPESGPDDLDKQNGNREGQDQPDLSKKLDPRSPGFNRKKKRISDLGPEPVSPLGDPYHGPDPHGDDPNDEVHDQDLPANQDQRKYSARKDPYNGTTSNDRNHPYRPYPH